MNDAKLLALVDNQNLRELFITELGWNNPDQPDRHYTIDDHTYSLTQVAGYKGLRIWFCANLPVRKIQRTLDELIGQDSHERLVIFADDNRQEWRWPRRAQLGGANAKLLVHQHLVGEPDAHMVKQLGTIAIDFDDDISLVDLLNKMRVAFDAEAEAASVQAARLMGDLYSALDTAGVEPVDASLLLARLLFLLFGDDGGMWRKDMFTQFLERNTSADTLHQDLARLFDVLNTPENRREAGIGAVLSEFRHINGGLFRDELELPPLGSLFRNVLVRACAFDWAIISPAVFGSMFQTVKDREARRRGGEHYTTEKNILKTIEPLFLDELKARLERARNDKGALTRLHNELGSIRVFDPACGCGNFLVVAYRELRALELELLIQRRELDRKDRIGERFQLSFDVTGDIKVTLDHFYGIEIEDWPARIAETAMLLVDHLANQQMAEEFGNAPDRLPIAIAPTIVRGVSALGIDWREVVPPTNEVYIVGNPPFLGHDSRTTEQAAELRRLWGQEIGRIDYVTGWYAKALEYFGPSINGRWAFVSTNSVTQGQPVALVFERVFRLGWSIHFAHRAFAWTSEAPGEAAVHCVIIGFSRGAKTLPRLFDYEHPRSKAVEITTREINAYLVDGPNVLVRARSRPLSAGIEPVNFGSRPNDGGGLIIKDDVKAPYSADPVAAKYLRRFVGAKELLHNKPRWVLWLVDAPESDLSNPLIAARLRISRQHREESERSATRDWADRPHLFDFISQPEVEYLCIPSASSEHRPYLATQRLPADVIASNLVFTAPDADGFQFALISSAMFMAWQQTIGGRLESRIRFSNTLVWNNFPLPKITLVQRTQIIEAAQGVLKARSQLRSSSTLAAQYDSNTMDPVLRTAHQHLDKAVDEAFGATSAPKLVERQELLFAAYRELEALDKLDVGNRPPKRRRRSSI